MATKRMLVDAIHPEETRIVVTAGNKLEDFDFESATRRQLRGNIYLAKVTRVEPSLQAAFIEYGGNRHGFLAFSEIHPDYYQIPVADREALLKAEEAEHAEEQPVDEPSEDVSPVDGEGDAEAGEAHDESNVEDAPSNAGPVESVGGDALEEVPERRQRQQMRRYKIQEVIKRRQVMLVQVVKEERGNKGAALTTYLSLAGRYSVLMPNTARGGGISRKITNAADRKRLKEITSDLEVPKGMGVILRTAGASRTKAEVKRDFEYLMRLWQNVRSLTLKSQAPCLVYEEGSLIKRTIRDLYSKDIDEVLVAGDEAYREAKDFMKMIMPSHVKNVKPYVEDQALFSRYAVESQLDQMFSPQVTLPSGGYLVINPTEALVSIDVNSGRSTKEHNIEDTALQTNLEAAEEVARQLRLRDLAGLIVIDFIDMVENRSNRAVERKLKDCLKDDRARIQVGRISHFGLMEMSRQRIRFGVVEGSTHKCPICEGTGLVRSTESLALMVMRHVEDHVLRKPGQSINVKVPVEVALYILNFKRSSLSALEARHDLSITITADGKLVGNQFLVERGEARPNAHGEARVVEHVRVDSAAIEDVAEDEDEIEETEDAEETVADAASGEAEGNGSRRRRRRRRRGSDRDDNGQRQTEARTVDLGEAAPESDEDEGEGDETGAETGTGETAEARDDNGERKRRRRGRRGGRRNRRDEVQAGEVQSGGAPAVDTEGVATQANADVAELPAVTGETGLAALPAEPADAETVASEPAEAPAAEAEAPAEKPKRTRRSRKTAAAEPAETDAASPAPAEAVSEEAPAEKPKRRTRRTKAAVETATPDLALEAASTPEAATADAEPAPDQAETAQAAEAPTEEPAATARPRRVRKDLPEEGVVVSSSTPRDEEAADGEPKKRGWWQRRLGLG